MRKAAVAVLVSALLFSAIAGTRFIDLTKANPYSQAEYKGEISPPSDPTVTISSPKNNTVCSTNSLSIALNVSIKKTSNEHYQQFISRVYYKADWLQGDINIYDSNSQITEFYYCLNLTGISEGKHNVTVYAFEDGTYRPSFLEYYILYANVSSVIIFTVDTTPPTVSVLSLQNRKYNASDVPLNFAVNESVSELRYSLDGRANVTFAGNTTLLTLPNGEHNVTVYATDVAGHVGVSETAYFSISVPEPFPTSYSMGIVAAMVLTLIGSIVYVLKRKS